MLPEHQSPDLLVQLGQLDPLALLVRLVQGSTGATGNPAGFRYKIGGDPGTSSGRLNDTSTATVQTMTFSVTSDLGENLSNYFSSITTTQKDRIFLQELNGQSHSSLVVSGVTNTNNTFTFTGSVSNSTGTTFGTTGDEVYAYFIAGAGGTGATGNTGPTGATGSVGATDCEWWLWFPI